MFKSRFIRNAGGLVVGRIDEDDLGSRGYDGGGTFVGRLSLLKTWSGPNSFANLNGFE